MHRQSSLHEAFNSPSRNGGHLIPPRDCSCHSFLPPVSLASVSFQIQRPIQACQTSQLSNGLTIVPKTCAWSYLTQKASTWELWLSTRRWLLLMVRSLLLQGGTGERPRRAMVASVVQKEREMRFSSIRFGTRMCSLAAVLWMPRCGSNGLPKASALWPACPCRFGAASELLKAQKLRRSQHSSDVP